MTRLEGRWTDDATPTSGRDDEVLAELTAERTRFVHAVVGWVAVVVFVAGIWLILVGVNLSEAAAAWLGMAVFLLAIVAIVAYAGRRGGPR